MIQALAIVIALAAAFGAVQSWRLDTAQDDLKELRAAQVAAALAYADNAARQSTAMTRAAEETDRVTQNKLRAARAAAAAARGDLQRVLDSTSVLAAAPADDTGVVGCTDGGRLGRLAGLLSEGAGLVEEGGRRVEQLAVEKAGLQRDAAELRRVLMTTGAQP